MYCKTGTTLSFLGTLEVVLQLLLPHCNNMWKKLSTASRGTVFEMRAYLRHPGVRYCLFSRQSKSFLKFVKCSLDVAV